jgi:hypothetical protein
MLAGVLDAPVRDYAEVELRDAYIRCRPSDWFLCG